MERSKSRKKGTVLLMVIRPLLRNGLKEVIQQEYDTIAFPSPSLTSLLSFSFKPCQLPLILVIDYDLVRAKNLLYIHNFINTYSAVKIIGLFESFRFQNILNLFKIGIAGAVDKNIDAKAFTEILDAVANGKRKLSQEFERELIQEFCRKDPDKILNDSNQKHHNNHNPSPYICPSQFFGVSDREIEVLGLVSRGKNTKAISDHLSISPHTVETHRRNLLGKLSAKNTAELVRIAVKEKLI